MSKDIVSAGGVVFCEFPDGLKFLLLKQRRGGWGFPKGHVEIGETNADTALREIQEEVGSLNFKILDRLDHELEYYVYERGRRRQKRVVLYLVEIPHEHVNDVVLSYEHTAFRWGTIDETKELLYENAHPALDEAVQRLAKRQVREE